MAPVAATARGGAGDLLRQWRQRRRLSQLDLALTADVSARHLSFVETGRSRPSRELLMHLAEHLEVPLRDRNALLLAAGYAPAFGERALDDREMEPVREALSKIVGSHEPYPAIVVDRGWDLVGANAAAAAILADGVAPELLVPPVNALRVSLHPGGLAPRIENLAEWATHLLQRLDRQIAASGDRELVALAAELRAYPGIRVAEDPGDVADRLFVPLAIRSRGEVLRFFSTVATFGTALDITVAELAIESFFPADTSTAGALGARLREASPQP
jgi:transcriptional regulator with XRE-family HTH domain